MSGGVDSSVAAALLAQEGYEVVGVTMRLFNAPNEQIAKLNKSCCSLEDVEDAMEVFLGDPCPRVIDAQAQPVLLVSNA